MSPISSSYLFFFNDTATTEIYTLSLHDALPIFGIAPAIQASQSVAGTGGRTRLEGVSAVSSPVVRSAFKTWVQQQVAACLWIWVWSWLGAIQRIHDLGGIHQACTATDTATTWHGAGALLQCSFNSGRGHCRIHRLHQGDHARYVRGSHGGALVESVALA